MTNKYSKYKESESNKTQIKSGISCMSQKPEIQVLRKTKFLNKMNFKSQISKNIQRKKVKLYKLEFF